MGSRRIYQEDTQMIHKNKKKKHSQNNYQE